MKLQTIIGNKRECLPVRQKSGILGIRTHYILSRKGREYWLPGSPTGLVGRHNLRCINIMNRDDFLVIFKIEKVIYEKERVGV